LRVIDTVDAGREDARLGEALQQAERVDDRLRVPTDARRGMIVERVGVAAVLGDERQEEVRASVARQAANRRRSSQSGLEDTG